MTLKRVKTMGEIRIKVKLSNASDDALNRSRKLAKKKIRTYEADAVVDRGAVRSVIPAHVLEKLGVGTRGTPRRWLCRRPNRIRRAQWRHHFRRSRPGHDRGSTGARR